MKAINTPIYINNQKKKEACGKDTTKLYNMLPVSYWRQKTQLAQGEECLEKLILIS